MPQTSPAGAHRGLSSNAWHRRHRKHRGPRRHRRDAHDGGHRGGTDDSEHGRYRGREESRWRHQIAHAQQEGRGGRAARQSDLQRVEVRLSRGVRPSEDAQPLLRIGKAPHRAKRDHHEELRLPKSGVSRSRSPIKMHGGPQDVLQSQGRGCHIPRRGGRNVDPPQVGEGSKNGACVRDAQVVHLRLHSWRGASSEDVRHPRQSKRSDRKGRRRQPNPQRRHRPNTQSSHYSRRGGCLCGGR